MPATFLWEPTPNTEAAKFITDKAPVSAAVFKRLLPELKARAFTITGVESADTLQAVRDRIADLPRGGNWEDIKEDVLKDISPWLVTSDDAEERAQQLRAANQRAELLIRTHGFQAYAVSNYQELISQTDIFPWWKYQSMEDAHVRATHAALDGCIFRWDSEFWQVHFPPWEWGCRCIVAPMMDEEVQDMITAEKDKPEVERLVINFPIGQSLKRLNPDPLTRDLKKYLDVELSPKTTSYRFDPSTLRMPISLIRERYDAETFSKFEQWAKATKFDDSRDIWSWLNGEAGGQKPEARPDAFHNALDVVINDEAMFRSFLPKATKQDVRKLANAPEGATVRVTMTDTNEAQLNWTSEKGSGRRVLTGNAADGYSCYNAYLKLDPTGTGLGAQLLYDQARTAQQLGFEDLQCFAAKGGGFVGYKVWPKLGYDGDLTKDQQGDIELAFGKRYQTIQEFLQAEGQEGETWWDRHGNGFDARFLLDAGSPSWQILQAYLRKKGLQS